MVAAVGYFSRTVSDKNNDYFGRKVHEYSPVHHQQPLTNSRQSAANVKVSVKPNTSTRKPTSKL